MRSIDSREGHLEKFLQRNREACKNRRELTAGGEKKRMQHAYGNTNDWEVVVEGKY